MTNRTRPVKTTKTSLALLREIRDSDGATLTALSDRLDLAKSTVHNHLVTLTDEGFLVREGDIYHVGLKFMAYGEHARARNDVYQAARERVYELATQTNNEVDFIVEENGQVYTLEYAIGEAGRVASSDASPFRAGNNFHMHNCASGKAILAEFSEERVREVIDRWGLPATTEQTITDEETLFAELAAVRERGYAFNDEELLDGYRSIGAAVTDPEGDVVGAFTVGGPTYRMAVDGQVRADTVELLFATVEDLETELF